MKITLKNKKDNTVESVQHEVESVNLLQVQKSLVVVKDIFEVVQKDESLKQAFGELFKDTDTDSDETEKDNAFIGQLLGAFDTLLLNIPDKAFELLGVLSGINKEVLLQQKAEDVFDIYDAILEVNDIEKLISRAKKSLAVTKSTINFKNLITRKQGTKQQ